jgi:alpha-1,6-mannosyltransferase
VVRALSVPVPRYRSLSIGLPSPRFEAALRLFRPQVVHLASPVALGAHGVAVARRLAPGGEVLVGYVGRLAAEKRVGLLAALAGLLGRWPRARLVVAGSGPLGRRLAGLAGGLPVGLLGHLGDRRVLAALLASADVVLAPGPVQTFGLAALEALASGTPVVAARTAPCPSCSAPTASHPTRPRSGPG